MCPSQSQVRKVSAHAAENLSGCRRVSPRVGDDDFGQAL
jgi:hypothetical protein